MAAYPKIRCAQGQLTLAQVNGTSHRGTLVVPDLAGRAITVVDGWVRSAAGGTVSVATAIAITDNSASYTVGWSVTAATCTLAAVCRMGGTGTTNTGVGTAMATGKGLRVCATVSDMTTCTYLDYCIYYTVSS